MDHGMTRVFATLFDKDTEMIQLAIESFGMVRRGSLLHLNDSTTHPIPSQMTIGCYRILTVRHLSHKNDNPKGSTRIHNLIFLQSSCSSKTHINMSISKAVR